MGIDMDYEEMKVLLRREPAGSLATTGRDGAPYITPVNYVYDEGKIYIHGRLTGRKADNLRADPRVCFNVYTMEEIRQKRPGDPCGTDAVYESVTVAGRAAEITDEADKTRALALIVKKYTPALAEAPVPAERVRATAVFTIAIDEMTGKRRA